MNWRGLILIAGPAGAGKTALAQRIGNSGVFRSPCVLSADWFYRPGLDNYDLPDSVDEAGLRNALATLSAHRELVLNYRDHSAKGTVSLKWHDALILEGLYVLSDSDLRAKADLRIYLTTNLYLAGARRALRDVVTYRDSVDRTLSRLQDQVVPALTESIEPQLSHADIRYSGDSDWPHLRERLLHLRDNA